MKYILNLENLSVSVDGRTIINSVNLAVKSGTLTILMGPNGSGKSSLSYAIAGHPRYVIDQGTIAIHGQAINDLSPDKRAHLGLFLAVQHPPEIPGVSINTFLKETYRAFKNKPLDMAEYKEKLEAVTKRLNINEGMLSRKLNDGFSGGEKKKFELLQMLMLEPRIAILDEIDSGLDVDALKIVISVLNEYQAQHPDSSILLITHNPHLLSYLKPDELHIMTRGSLVYSGDSSIAHQLETKGFDELRL